jgi:hypothetical protein
LEDIKSFEDLVSWTDGNGDGKITQEEYEEYLIWAGDTYCSTFTDFSALVTFD